MEWANQDRKVFNHIVKLINECTRDPFKGIGKPEPLRGNYKGYWSRRINDYHWLIYKVSENAIILVDCKSHY